MELLLSPSYPHVFMMQCFIRQGNNSAFIFWFAGFCVLETYMRGGGGLIIIWIYKVGNKMLV
jgi:hypothetical protein